MELFFRAVRTASEQFQESLEIIRKTDRPYHSRDFPEWIFSPAQFLLGASCGGAYVHRLDLFGEGTGRDLTVSFVLYLQISDLVCQIDAFRSECLDFCSDTDGIARVGVLAERKSFESSTCFAIRDS